MGGLDQPVPNCGAAPVLAYFVINQLASPTLAPSSIQVFFSDGSSATYPLLTVDGPVAKYQGLVPAGSRVTDATAVIYSSWSGRFNLSHYFCGTSEVTTTTEATTTTSIAETTTTGVTATTVAGTTSTLVPLVSSSPALRISRLGHPSQVRPRALAATGRDLEPVALTGGAAVLGGSVIALSARRRRR